MGGNDWNEKLPKSGYKKMSLPNCDQFFSSRFTYVKTHKMTTSHFV